MPTKNQETMAVVNTIPARKAMLLRLDPAVHYALARWAEEDSRSLNSHIELLLRGNLTAANRMPADARPLRRPGRPPLTTYR